MRPTLRLLSWCLLLCGTSAHGQIVVGEREVLDSDRPEAWAMNLAAANTLMTAFGETPVLAAGDWQLGLELGAVPRLDEEQRQVGFNGFKSEDLNKSPVFGRVRVFAGLGRGWVGELGYTPPLRIDGTQARGLVSLAFGHAWLRRGSWSLSSRIFGQHGSVVGDITCPAKLAGLDDEIRNPYGCQAPSKDRVRLNYYGADLVAAGLRGDWQWHLGVGLVRSELSVQVDALTFDFRDLSYLSASGHIGYVAFGVNGRLAPHWRWGGEWRYVPLRVRRDPGESTGNDALSTFRIHLTYHRD